MRANGSAAQADGQCNREGYCPCCKAWARVKRWCKRPPARSAMGAAGKPHREQGQAEARGCSSRYQLRVDCMRRPREWRPREMITARKGTEGGLCGTWALCTHNRARICRVNALEGEGIQMPNTWRHKQAPAQPTITKGDLIAYLSPTMPNEGFSAPIAVSEPVKRRVADREEVRQLKLELGS